MLRYGRFRSRHCWLDEEHLYGECRIMDHAYIFVLKARWTGHILDSHVVCRGSIGFDKCVADWRAYVSRFLSRGSPVPPSYGGDVDLSKTAFGAAYPACTEYLTVTDVDGHSRETSTVLICFEGGRFRACLRDRDRGLVLWASAEDMEGLWCNLERRLSGVAEPDWRPDQYNRKKGGGKRP